MSSSTEQRGTGWGSRAASFGAVPADAVEARLPRGPVVKLCGLTRVEDVVLAGLAGVWAVGFIFAPSARRLTPGDARRLLEQARKEVALAGIGADAAGSRRTVADRSPLTVGVFGEVSPEEIAAVVRHVGLDAVQLHGASGPAPAEVKEALGGWAPPHRLADPTLAHDGGEDDRKLPVELLIIRAVGVAEDEGDAAALRLRLREAIEQDALPLVDASVAGCTGGTGRQVPWDLVREAAAGRRFLLAGGIRPDNVREAMDVSGAWGVDVSSGVESAPGIKEREAFKTLMVNIDEVRQARGESKPR